MTLTGDYILLFFGILALVLMSMSNRNILIALASSMVWFALFMWMFFSTTPPLSLGETWVDILAWVFLLLTILPWLLRMDIEIRHEAKGQSWKVWGKEPEGRMTPYEDYRNKLFMRTRGHKR